MWGGVAFPAWKNGEKRETGKKLNPQQSSKKNQKNREILTVPGELGARVQTKNGTIRRRKD